MKIDYKALMELIALAEIQKTDPKSAKLYSVFMKRGISMTDAMAILFDLCALIAEEEGEDNG